MRELLLFLISVLGTGTTNILHLLLQVVFQVLQVLASLQEDYISPNKGRGKMHNLQLRLNQNM